MERRLPGPLSAKFSSLPIDYTKMVNEVFKSNFDAQLKAFSKVAGANSYFDISGKIFANEINLYVSLVTEGQIAATTAVASSDFDPKASSPTVEDLLGASVDAVGELFQALMDESKPKCLEQLADASSAALENAPLEWTLIKLDRYQIYLKVDKSNPHLERITETWLEKNDPSYKERQVLEAEETEKLFVTGKKKPPGPLH